MEEDALNVAVVEYRVVGRKIIGETSDRVNRRRTFGSVLI
jgi:hypothetical protein